MKFFSLFPFHLHFTTFSIHLQFFPDLCHLISQSSTSPLHPSNSQQWLPLFLAQSNPEFHTKRPPPPTNSLTSPANCILMARRNSQETTNLQPNHRPFLFILSPCLFHGCQLSPIALHLSDYHDYNRLSIPGTLITNVVKCSPSTLPQFFPARYRVIHTS